MGKTELAKALAEFLFNDESMMTRIDMSENQEAHTVSRLVGAPPGYVGYDEGGQLTEAVRRKPYSVVLLDEIEKAHPDVFNTLLQVLDSLSREDIRQIVRIQMSLLQKKLEDDSVELEYTPAFEDWAVENGYDPDFGARPVKRLIQREHVNRLAKEILEGHVYKGSAIRVDAVDGEPIITQ